jgi:hypothetical protein
MKHMTARNCPGYFSFWRLDNWRLLTTTAWGRRGLEERERGRSQKSAAAATGLGPQSGIGQVSLAMGMTRRYQPRLFEPVENDGGFDCNCETAAGETLRRVVRE